ncbi:MAG: long-chain fatty acid--CoA ligase [Gemmatimonadetes bacterium]|nr:long-chain fatty acid--CoA ligase [Gemmatimonadota bacterium]
MKGGMMQVPLTVPALLERAATLFPLKPVVTASGEGPVRLGWREVRDRSWALAAALPSLGVGKGDRVASLAWNSHRHLELYFGVPASGAVLLTANVRLSAEQVGRILQHAGARAIFADPEFVPLAEEASRALPAATPKVVLGADAPEGWTACEALLASADPSAPRPALDEDAAAGLCYTSGTTGEPKGVLYSHRAIALHTLAICLPDAFGLGESDVILPAVPMFHANAWGLAHAAAMTGATLVLPGARPSAAHLATLLAEEQVTFAAGVPTVWMGVLEELRRRPRALSPRLRIHSGGAPTPPSLLEAYRTELGVEILSGWGMTELTPVGLVCHPRGEMSGWSPERLLPVRTAQVTPLPFLEMRITDDQGRPVPADGSTPGELEVRGPWVTGGYFHAPGDEAFRDGWFRTGDVATQDAWGYVRLVDRTKDLIRSGGEWISSVQLEHALTDHPAVGEAAGVAVPHPKWGERPMACVALRPGARATPDELLGSLAGRFPRWWVPDGVVFLDAVPRTSTGKYDKRALRKLLRGGG